MSKPENAQPELMRAETRGKYLCEEGVPIKDAFHSVIVAPGLGNTLAEALPQITSQRVSAKTTRLMIEHVKIKNDLVEVPPFDEQVRRIRETVQYSLRNGTPCTIVCHSLGALGTIKALSEFSDTELRSVNVIMINPVHYRLDTIFTSRCKLIELADKSLLTGHPPHLIHLPADFVDSLKYDPQDDLVNLVSKAGSITIFQSTEDTKYLISEEEKKSFIQMVEKAPHGKHLLVPGSHTVKNHIERELLAQQITNEIAHQELRYKVHRRRLMLFHGALDQIIALSTEFPETFTATAGFPKTIKTIGKQMISMIPDTIYFDVSSVDISTRVSSNFIKMIANAAERVIVSESLQQKKKIESFSQG